MPDRRVLVVGTTPDYVAVIRERYAGRALFLSDLSQYGPESSFRPNDADEIVCDLRDRENVLETLERQLNRRRVRLSGVTGYDCEWLVLAAEVAQRYDLPYPSPESVRLTRDKFLTKQRWQESGVRCPKASLIRTAGEAIDFVRGLGKPVVFKPLSGSGSELTFRCESVSEVETLLHRMSKGLIERSRRPLYSGNSSESQNSSGALAVLAEEFIEGTEYGADFIVDGDRIKVVRVARKIQNRKMPFGTTVAYEVPGQLPQGLNYDLLGHHLLKAAHALSLSRAQCMADFILAGEQVIFLELTPRIGGDCLPPLIQQSCGLDTIGMALDFSENRPSTVPPPEDWQHLVGLRLLAGQRGVVFRIDPTVLQQDPRVREVFLKRSAGDEVNLPPHDYDSWVLGHVVYSPVPELSLADQCEDMRQKLLVEMEPKNDGKLARTSDSGRRALQSADPAA